MSNSTVAMTYHRNHVHASTSGHVVRFTKGQTTDVPTIVAEECFTIGAEYVDGKEEVGSEEAQPITVEARREAIAQQVAAMFTENNRDDFTATGTPNLKTLSARTGFKVDRSELNDAMKARTDAD